MKNQIAKIISIILFLASIGCNDAWEDQKKINPDTPDKTLMEMLRSNADYSKFSDALTETGLDKLLNSTKLYSVWVPSNNSIDALPDDSASLYMWVANHIMVGAERIDNLEFSSVRLKMLSGKVLEINTDESTIDKISFDPTYIVAKNGIYYQLEGILTPIINMWEYVENVAPSNEHVNYINSLSGEVFDPDSADIVGYTQSGFPIYDTLSGMVWKNLFLEDVADLSSEDSTYTMFIVDDPVFDSEYQKYFQYFKITSGITKKDSLRNSAVCKYKITKDYVITTTYTYDELPSYVISPEYVKVPVDKSAIHNMYKCSNGWVYHISDCSIAKSDKILPIIVEGEAEDRIYDNYWINGHEMDGDQYGYKRINPYASGGFDYVVDNWTTNVIGSGLVLHAGQVASTRYKFYLRAVHDFNGSFRRPKAAGYVLNQRLGWATLISESLNGYNFNPPLWVSDTIAVTDSTYINAPEIEVGTYKFTSMKDAYLWLQSFDNGAAVVADYIKLVPDFN